MEAQNGDIGDVGGDAVLAPRLLLIGIVVQPLVSTGGWIRILGSKTSAVCVIFYEIEQPAPIDNQQDRSKHMFLRSYETIADSLQDRRGQ
jgi:hypothetical protein